MSLLVLEAARIAGLSIRFIPPDRLGISPAELLTDELRAELVTHKPAIIAALAEDGPPDDPESNRLRAELLWWGQPLGLPSLVEVNLGPGVPAWTEWLEVADRDQLQAAVEAARSRGHMAHPDPRCRLANWAIDARYPNLHGLVDGGDDVMARLDAWEHFLEEADDESINMALEAMPWPIPG